MQRTFQFYIVPTPIGNLDDITIRAIEVLKSVDIICCEDSRVTKNLLNHLGISTKLISYHKYNEKSRVNEILELLNSGKTVALVSDAGTPMICDPGNVLISELRNANISFTSLTGSCAIPVFLSQISRDTEVFTFAGFFPKTQQFAKNLLQEYSKSNLVFYESPNRIIDTLNFIKQVRGEVKIALGRELTKLFEETIVDNVSNVISYFKDGIKGEIVCMVYSSDDNSTIDIDSKILKLKEKGFKSKDISVILSTLFDINKNDVYKRVMEL